MDDQRRRKNRPISPLPIARALFLMQKHSIAPERPLRAISRQLRARERATAFFLNAPREHGSAIDRAHVQMVQGTVLFSSPDKTSDRNHGESAKRKLCALRIPSNAGKARATASRPSCIREKADALLSRSSGDTAAAGMKTTDPFSYSFSIAAKSASASGILICWGQTASHAPQPMQADGCLSSGSAPSAMGAMKPPPVSLCSL